MDETAKGFRPGGGIFSWGTRFNAVVRDEWKSRGIADTVRLLERLPGLAFRRHSGHDA